jgi:hypothetical protein
VRDRTKAAPRPRFKPGPVLARAAFDLERGDDGEDDRDGLLLCWRAIFFAWVKKLLALPILGASARTRPGLGRKRNSSSSLKAAPPGRDHGKQPISG